MKNMITYGLLIAFTAGLLACDAAREADDLGGYTDESVEKEMNTQYQRVRVTSVAQNLEHPWAVAFKPDGSMLVTERTGSLKHIKDGSATEISGLPEINSFGQGGLMDVVLHPDYEDNGWIYITYSKPNDSDETATALIRARIDGDSLIDVEELFVQDRYSEPGRHYGSRLAWTNDGYLLMSIGDRGANPPRAQDNADHAGTLLRMYDDGSVPDSNPFVGRDDHQPEIFSYGHRNIQGLVVNPETDEIWVTEHGPRGGDLLHRVEKGKNYGWPKVTQGFDYRTQEYYTYHESRQMDGVEEPFFEFLPTLAPSGLALVTSESFGHWQGDLLAGGLRSRRILRTTLGADEVYHLEELFTLEFGRIRDVRQGPDGNIYFVTDHSDGALYKVEAIERS